MSGGGPAGIVLGLLLARAGVRVTVLEKHDDFLRDFRGDTVHPTTQAVLAQLGLLQRFDAIVRGRIDTVQMGTRDRVILRAELAGAAPRSPFRQIALAPQWDLLDLLVSEARHHGMFELRMGAETVGVLRRPDGSLRGVRYRDDRGEHDVEAVLTVAADGRRSGIRNEIGGGLVDLGAPMDVLWLRLPRTDEDEGGLRGVLGDGEVGVCIDRGDYWQIALLVPKGSVDAIRTQGVERLRDRIAALLPFLADRTGQLRSMDEVKTLRVGLDRLRRWHSPGGLVIGDAAHTMTPIGGVGINLAVQDAVAAANLLTGPLLAAQADPRRHDRILNPALTARVTRRRRLPTVLTQAFQRLVGQRILGRALRGGGPRIPFLLAADLRNNGLVARALVRLLVYGIRPEQVALRGYRARG